MYNISEQIDTWTQKITYYENKKLYLRKRIKLCEELREDVNELPVGHPDVDRFYRHLNSLYTQLATLSVKIRHCKDNILTLQCKL